MILRADSAYYNHDVIAAAHRHGARFSITARQDPAVRGAIATIGEQTWTPIHYPNAIWDEDHQRLISDAEVAEIPFTAFTSRAKRQHVHGRLIVRRVRDANPDHVQVNGQGELFPAGGTMACSPTHPCRCSAPKPPTAATRPSSRSIADLKSGPIAHLPSALFTANAA